jgi:peptide/nickel transport system substrate-binding protein
MNKKILLSTLFAFLLLNVIPMAFALPLKPAPYDPNTLILDSIGEPETVDPAWGYDTASSDVIQNVYETLAWYKVDRTRGPYAAGLVDQFVGMVAKSWTYVDISDYTNLGVTIKNRFYFEIRTGIPFHRGWGTLSTEDVEYSFEREMVQDRDGGPQWMLYEYLLNAYGASSPDDDADWGAKIDHSVQRNSTHVWFNMASDFPALTVMQINAYCGGIVSKAWASSIGDFDGIWAAGWQTIWDTWHNPPTSYIEYDEADAATKPVGTGPYQFSYWNHGSSWSITKFDAYWDLWPSKVYEDLGSGTPNRISGYLTTITWYLYTQWTTRRPRLLAGDSDFADVDRLYRDQVLGQPGIRCFYPISVLAVTGYFFTFDITTTSPYVPTFYPSGQFGLNGIPADIFNDLNVRKGFAYAFDYNSWLTNVYLGEGWQPPEAVIRGLAYNRRNSENTYFTDPLYAPSFDEEDPTLLGPPYKYYYSLTKATYHLKLAWGGVDANSNGVIDPVNEPGDVEGALWTGGMKFVIVYNTGNVARQLAAEMITNKINSLGNPNFQLQPPFAAAWGSVMLPQMVNGELPIFLIGWAADYPDPHNFVHPFYHPDGTFSAWQKYNDPTMKSLIETGIATPDGPARSAIYQQIQERAVNEAPSVMVVQALGRHYERDLTVGWYYHPIAQDYFYHFYKGKSEQGDATWDGIEDIADKGFIASHWTGAPGTTYNPSGDISGGTGGTLGSESGLVLGIHDGRVNIVDMAVLNANWDS